MCHARKTLGTSEPVDLYDLMPFIGFEPSPGCLPGCHCSLIVAVALVMLSKAASV
jgi:hypothetical protein